MSKRVRKSGDDDQRDNKVERALDLLDDEVERAHYKMAVGYRAEVKEGVWDPKRHKHIAMKIEKYFPPDLAAARFWLRDSGRDNARDDEVKRALDLLDVEVKRALLKMALGYRAMVEELRWDRKLGKPIILKVKIDFPPNAAALRFVLTNRAPRTLNEPFTFNIFEKNLAPKDHVPERIQFEVDRRLFPRRMFLQE